MCFSGRSVCEIIALDDQKNKNNSSERFSDALLSDKTSSVKFIHDPFPMFIKLSRFIFFLNASNVPTIKAFHSTDMMCFVVKDFSVKKTTSLYESFI